MAYGRKRKGSRGDVVQVEWGCGLVPKSGWAKSHMEEKDGDNTLVNRCDWQRSAG